MIGIFGGTFDPVHLGHLALAKSVYVKLGLRRVIFMPLGTPPHRDQPQVSAQCRVKMLQAAVSEFENFEVSTLEADKKSTSWTVQSLAHFSSEMPDETFCLLMGSDAFKSINQWYRWKSLLDYCHIVVVSRTGDNLSLNSEVEEFMRQHQSQSLCEMTAGTSGSIYWLEADIPDISSTSIRQRIGAAKSLSGLLPRAVENLIKENEHYGY